MSFLTICSGVLIADIDRSKNVAVVSKQFPIMNFVHQCSKNDDRIPPTSSHEETKTAKKKKKKKKTGEGFFVLSR